jgi:dipeptidase D
MTHLHPHEVWGYFDDILKIPRVSKKEEKILAYLEAFAKKHGLDSERDTAGNIVIRKSATQGMEDRVTMIIQGHVDMVAEKLSEVEHDFSKDPIQAVEKDGWIMAEGTTLGADDGIGVAAALAILASDSIIHGPIECLFTVDEETGMTGALELKDDMLTGSVLLNLDSEDEGEIFIGCAGGIDTMGTFHADFETVKEDAVAFRIRVDGLKGGHSGDEIHKGLGNAIKILNRVIWSIQKEYPVRMASIHGGKLRNAIPREAEAVVVAPAKDTGAINGFFKPYTECVKGEYKEIDPDLVITIEEEELPEKIYAEEFQRSFMQMLYDCPHGAIAWSQDIPGLVETSTNLAVVRETSSGAIEVVTSQRSSVESSKKELAESIATLFKEAGGEAVHSGGYPGWKPDRNSEILHISEQSYRNLFNEQPRIKAVHAGLECGLFLQKYPGLDMISFGPTIKGAHTPEERIEIESVDKFWRFLLDLLEKAPVKKPA